MFVGLTEVTKDMLTKLFEPVHKDKVYMHLLVSTPYRIRLMYGQGISLTDTAKYASHEE